MRRTEPPDIDVILECCKKAGVKVEYVGPGKGGIYCNGEKVDDIVKLIEDCFKELASEETS